MILSHLASLAPVFSCSVHTDVTGEAVAVADGDTTTMLRDREQP